MFTIIVLVGIAIFSETEALECGLRMNKNALLKDTLGKCVRNNDTLEKIWDLTSPFSDEDSSSSSSSSSSSEEEQSTATVLDTKIMKLRKKRNEEESNPTSTEATITANCITQCVFTNLGMVDSKGFPIQTKMLEGLLKEVTGRELRDFLQESTGECFLALEKESSLEPCAYSSKLVTCLADHGKANCADWPVGDLPI